MTLREMITLARHPWYWRWRAKRWQYGPGNGIAVPPFPARRWGAASRGSGRAQGQRASRANSLVADLTAFIRQYVVANEAQLLVVALWVIHTHCASRFVEQTPYLAVTSPEPKCGKSRLLETLELLVARPWMAVLPSEAVVYRSVDSRMPTLLLDEVDTIFNPRTADRHEGLRALINAGHRRGAKVPRCVGPTSKIVEFSVFCPKVLAGIGTLPDTIASRSIPIRLQRRKADEKVEQFRRHTAEPVADALVARIEAWVERHAESLRDVHPDMPAQLDDRMQEGCESLVLIADALRVGTRARAALVELLSGERLDDQESMRIRLLRDIKEIVEAEEKRRKGARVPGVFTETLLAKLYAIEEAPWGNYYGRGFEARDLASLLRHYGIQPTTIRSKDKVAKGYKRDVLHEAWERYLER